MIPLHNCLRTSRLLQVLANTEQGGGAVSCELRRQSVDPYTREYPGRNTRVDGWC